jgi:hypothetical protein
VHGIIADAQLALSFNALAREGQNTNASVGHSRSFRMVQARESGLSGPACTCSRSQIALMCHARMDPHRLHHLLCPGPWQQAGKIPGPESVACVAVLAITGGGPT